MVRCQALCFAAIYLALGGVPLGAQRSELPVAGKGDRKIENRESPDSSVFTLPLGNFRDRYECAGRPHFLGVIVPLDNSCELEREEGDPTVNGKGVSGDQKSVIESAFLSVYQEAGATLTFMDEAEYRRNEWERPSRLFLLPTYSSDHFWRGKGDLMIEVAVGFRSELPSRWEMVVLLYDIRVFGGLIFCVNSNELYGFTNKSDHRRDHGAANLRSVSRRLARYLLQHARLPTFDYRY
jgi:hypothetical protein